MGYKYEYNIKYTDNPYIDLLVHQTKNMAINSVIKNERTALKYETEQSRTDSDELIRYRLGKWESKLSQQDIDDYINILKLDGIIDQDKINELVNDYIDANKYHEENYLETNNYYRMLQGLPPLPTDTDFKAYYEKYGEEADQSKLFELFYIPLDQYADMITTSIKGSNDDESTIIDLHGHYLHEYYNDNTIINLLEINGIMDRIKEDYTDSSFSYIYHLGEKSIDPYTARTAPNYTLLYIPNCEFNEIYYKFIRTYEKNRLYTISTIYSEAYAFGSIHYDDFIQIFIIIQTMIDMISEVQEYIINKDVFDSRTIRYLFESYGIDYYKEIPVQYQMRIIKNVNQLLKYKSTNQNIEDILLLFDRPDIEVFTYYLMKTKQVPKEEFSYYSKDDINPVYTTSNTVEDVENKRYLIKYYTKDNIVENNRMLLQKRYHEIITDDYGHTIINLNKDEESLRKDAGWVSTGIVRKNVNDDGVLTSDLEIDLNNIPLYNSSFSDNDSYVTEDMIGLENYQKNYNMVFLRVPILDQNASDYIEDLSCRRGYDYITKQDPFWDGVSSVDILTDQERENYHNAKRREILATDFSCIRTKYISVEGAIDVTKMSYQLSYFMNILFDKHFDEDNLKITVNPRISKNKVRLSDLFCLVIGLGYLFYDVEPDMIDSDMERNMTINGFNFDTDWSAIYDALGRSNNGYLVEIDSDNPGAFLSGRYSQSEIWDKLKNTKINDVYESYDDYIFNDEDYNKNFPAYLKPALNNGMYSLDNIGEDENGTYHMIDLTWSTPYDTSQNSNADFINTSELIDMNGINPNTGLEYTDLERINKLKEIYYTNTKLYNHLTYMMRTAESKRMYDIYNTLFESFMETKMCHEFYNIKDSNGNLVYEDDKGNKYTLNEEENIYISNTTSNTVEATTDSSGNIIPKKDSNLKPRIAKDYYEFLYNRDTNLYNILKEAANYDNKDEKQSFISMICDYISQALEIYFDTNEWKYLYNLIPTRDLESFTRYIMKMIIFFKSWKTQILDETVNYIIDDPYHNQVRILDDIEDFDVIHNLYEKPGPRDYMDWNNSIQVNEKISPYEKIFISTFIGFYQTTEVDYYYDIDEIGNSVTLIKYIGKGYQAIIVPKTIEGYNVKYIETACFNGNKEILNVKIPEGIETIG